MPAAKWEYKLISGPLAESELMALGADGWELVTQNVDWAASLESMAFLWVFKRVSGR